MTWTILKEAHTPPIDAHKPLKLTWTILTKAKTPLREAYKPLREAYKPLREAQKPLTEAQKPLTLSVSVRGKTVLSLSSGVSCYQVGTQRTANVKHPDPEIKHHPVKKPHASVNGQHFVVIELHNCPNIKRL